MNEIFFRILNMSIMAGLLSIVVILLRLLLKRVPKWIICLLWAIVGLRLIIPFNIESPVSLMPEQIANGSYVQDLLYEQQIEDSYSPQAELSENVAYQDTETNAVYLDTETNVAYQDAETQSQSSPETHSEVSRTVRISAADWLKAHLWMIWAAGADVMLLHALFSFIRLKLKLKTSIRMEDTGGHIRVYANDDIVSPFLLGILRPVIYVPSSLYADKESSAFKYVLEHERAHISRWDHIWKPLGFLLLSINWFNPLLWISYILLCRDIEAACDEKVIKDLAQDERTDYSRTLLEFSSPRREIAACPVAFGETGTKNRIKAVLKYKKPAFWTVIASIVICIAAAVCLLTIRSAGNNEKAENIISSDWDFSAAVGDIPDEAQIVYDRAFYSFKDKDPSFKPIALLGTKTVSAETYYAFLVRSTPGLIDRESTGFVVATVSDDHAGQCTIVEWAPFDITMFYITGRTAEMAESSENLGIYYEKDSEGKYIYEGDAYSYKILLEGSLPNAAAESWYIVLTNNQSITFNDVAKSSYSSQSSDHLTDTIVIGMGTYGKNAAEGEWMPYIPTEHGFNVPMGRAVNARLEARLAYLGEIEDEHHHVIAELCPGPQIVYTTYNYDDKSGEEFIVNLAISDFTPAANKASEADESQGYYSDPPEGNEDVQSESLDALLAPYIEIIEKVNEETGVQMYIPEENKERVYEYYKDYSLEEFEQSLLNDLDHTISSEGTLSLPPDDGMEMNSEYYPDTKESDFTFLNTLVNEAIGVLAESWNDYCWDSNNPDNKHTLDIRSTRVICIKDAFDEAQEEYLLGVQEELFGNVRYIIEFYAYSDVLFNNTYSYPVTADVIIYDDGNMEWAAKSFLQKYISRTFSNDFSAFIEQVIDLHEEYNQVIHFQNHEIFYEKPQN